MADFTRGIPTDCSMNFSLMLQLAPMMASMECLLKILKFIGAIVGVLKSFKPADSAVARRPERPRKISPNASNMVLPLGPICCFVKDLLKLIATMLLCAITDAGEHARAS